MSDPQEWAEACAKAREHLETAELQLTEISKHGKAGTPMSDPDMAGGIKVLRVTLDMAEAWSRYALAVKP